jgi:hypothetical protein
MARVLAAVMWTLAAICVFSLVKPRVIVEMSGEETSVQIDPSVIRQEGSMLAVALVCGALAVLAGGRRWTVAGLALVLVLPVVVWHQAASRVVVTTDALTAPVEPGILPGPPTTVRFDQMAALRLYGRGSSQSKFQYAYMKNGAVIRFELGPLIEAAGPWIEKRAQARAVRVMWEK